MRTLQQYIEFTYDTVATIMYIIILYHIDFYHDFYVSIHRNFWGSMFQFTEIAGENN